MTGINNVKLPSASIDEVIRKVDETYKKYSQAFPNAKIHVAAIPPANDKYRMYNKKLRDLAIQRGAPYIAVDEMFDRNSGQLRPDMVSGIHFTRTGIKILAKQMKRSLYRDRIYQRTDAFTDARKSPGEGQRQAIARPGNDPKVEITKFLNMAISRLGNL